MMHFSPQKLKQSILWLLFYARLSLTCFYYQLLFQVKNNIADPHNVQV